MSSVESDLRQHEASQAKAEAIHDAYGEKVIEAFVDDIMSGRGIRDGRHTYTAVDFINDGLGGEPQGVENFIEPDDLAVLLLRPAGHEHWEAVRDRLQKALAQRVRNWLEESTTGTDLVDQRVRDWAEDDAQRYREEA